MHQKDFMAAAVITESKVPEITANRRALKELLLTFANIGESLDYMKKNIFYNKPVDEQKLFEFMSVAAANIRMAITFQNHVEKETLFNDVTKSRVLHAILGIITELSEMITAVVPWLFNDAESFDKVNVLEESGDIDWYQAILVDALEGDPDLILERIVAKLKARYPEGFSNYHAQNRDLDAERKILDDLE